MKNGDFPLCHSYGSLPEGNEVVTDVTGGYKPNNRGPRYTKISTIVIYTLRRCGWLMIDQHVLACSPKTGLLFLPFCWVWVGWGTNVQVHMHTYLMLRYGCVVLHLHIYSMPVQTSESALAHILDDMFPLYQILVIVV